MRYVFCIRQQETGDIAANCCFASCRSSVPSSTTNRILNETVMNRPVVALAAFRAAPMASEAAGCENRLVEIFRRDLCEFIGQLNRRVIDKAKRREGQFLKLCLDGRDNPGMAMVNLMNRIAGKIHASSIAPVRNPDSLRLDNGRYAGGRQAPVQGHSGIPIKKRYRTWSDRPLQPGFSCGGRIGFTVGVDKLCCHSLLPMRARYQPETLAFTEESSPA